MDLVLQDKSVSNSLIEEGRRHVERFHNKNTNAVINRIPDITYAIATKLCIIIFFVVFWFLFIFYDGSGFRTWFIRSDSRSICCLDSRNGYNTDRDNQFAILGRCVSYGIKAAPASHMAYFGSTNLIMHIFRHTDKSSCICR